MATYAKPVGRAFLIDEDISMGDVDYDCGNPLTSLGPQNLISTRNTLYCIKKLSILNMKT